MPLDDEYSDDLEFAVPEMERRLSMIVPMGALEQATQEIVNPTESHSEILDIVSRIYQPARQDFITTQPEEVGEEVDWQRYAPSGLIPTLTLPGASTPVVEQVASAEFPASGLWTMPVPARSDFGGGFGAANTTKNNPGKGSKTLLIAALVGLVLLARKG